MTPKHSLQKLEGSKINSKNKKLYEVDNGYHETMNDVERNEIWPKILEWIKDNKETNKFDSRKILRSVSDECESGQSAVELVVFQVQKNVENIGADSLPLHRI